MAQRGAQGDGVIGRSIGCLGAVTSRLRELSWARCIRPPRRAVRAPAGAGPPGGLDGQRQAAGRLAGVQAQGAPGASFAQLASRVQQRELQRGAAFLDCAHVGHRQRRRAVHYARQTVRTRTPVARAQRTRLGAVPRRQQQAPVAVP